jgi:pyruvate,orthophosphate dikinase
MAEAGKTVLLVRSETSPDDVHGMAKAAGILTTTGGLASHAAVVARGWGIPAVVGAATVEVNGESVVIDGNRYDTGDVLTIDGSTGDVLVGAVSSGAQIVPEAAKLLAWASDAGIAIGQQEQREDGDGLVVATESARELSRKDIVHALMIKGFAVPNDLAPAMLSTPDEVGALLDGMVAEGLAEIIGGSALAGMFQLSADGKAFGSEGIDADRKTWGAEQATTALDDLLPFDHRMKEIMTGWQMREVDGEQVLNDHSDSEHDAAVLAEFQSLHKDSNVWLESLAEGLQRLALYVARLARAADQVAGGDTMYLASPRVDSFHSIWFELHEDLILLAGRTREEEVAAGRA